MITLAARSISFGYSSRALVLQNISLELQAGELMMILGANGSGKTTLLRLLAGHLVPQDGRVTLNEQPLARFARRELAQQLSYLPQAESRDIALTVREVVRLGRTPHRGWWKAWTAEDEQAVDEALFTTGLVSLAQRYSHQLSGGEWQRMVLARSLAQKAPTLLLDEPLDGLDLKYQIECMQQIQRLTRDRNTAVAMTLHDLNHAAQFADRIALLGERALITIGSPEQVLTVENIRRAYGVDVDVIRHPTLGTPLVAPRL